MEEKLPAGEWYRIWMGCGLRRTLGAADGLAVCTGVFCRLTTNERCPFAIWRCRRRGAAPWLHLRHARGGQHQRAPGLGGGAVESGEWREWRLPQFLYAWAGRSGGCRGTDSGSRMLPKQLTLPVPPFPACHQALERAAHQDAGWDWHSRTLLLESKHPLPSPMCMTTGAEHAAHQDAGRHPHRWSRLCAARQVCFARRAGAAAGSKPAWASSCARPAAASTWRTLMLRVRARLRPLAVQCGCGGQGGSQRCAGPRSAPRSDGRLADWAVRVRRSCIGLAGAREGRMPCRMATAVQPSAAPRLGLPCWTAASQVALAVVFSCAHSCSKLVVCMML